MSHDALSHMIVSALIHGVIYAAVELGASG
jgi:hypothetical protein